MSDLFEIYKGMLSDQGVELTKDMTILEIGCGRGDLLYEMNEKGYSAKGTDLVSYGYAVRDDIKHQFAPIIESPYEFPFPDDTFDFVFSNQVVEHVQDHDVYFGEISRVLRKGGVSIHIFPSKYRLIESHVMVPLGGIFTSKRYFKFWARVGVKYAGQKGWSVDKVARSNYKLVSERTNYVTRKRLQTLLKPYFTQIKYIEYSFLKHGHGRAASYLSGVIDIVPSVANIYGILHTIAIFIRK